MSSQTPPLMIPQDRFLMEGYPNPLMLMSPRSPGLCKCEDCNAGSLDVKCQFCDGEVIRNPFSDTFELVRVLYSTEQIARKVSYLASEIDSIFMKDRISKNVVLLGALTGAFVFLADLSRAMKTPHTVEMVRASSYHGGTESSGTVNLGPLEGLELEGKDIVVVEDILDTGLTYQALRAALLALNPRSVRFTALLSKPDKLAVDGLDIDETLIGFQLRPPRFVVGYGLDYRGYFRGLPFIAEAKEKDNN